MPNNETILIIKIGATGDVVRTTTLLHLYKNCQVHWVTAAHNRAVLPQQNPCLQHIYSLQQAQTGALNNLHFDLIISLDDDTECAQLASLLKSTRIFGAYWNGQKVVYSQDSNEWFDMGLSSRLGKQAADELKWKNKDSYQSILFRMLGYEFTSEHVYLIPEEVEANPKPKTIGLENRAGARWPTKLWDKYEELATKLRAEGFEIIYFEDRDNIVDYFQDISRVSAMVCGDTLGMHIALALQIPTVGIFTCTSAVEIEAYGCMQKVVSPFLEEAFYLTDYLPHVVQAISVDEVYQKLMTQIHK